MPKNCGMKYVYICIDFNNNNEIKYYFIFHKVQVWPNALKWMNSKFDIIEN